MYRAIAHRGVVNVRMQTLWKNKLPKKLKVFMWQAMNDKLPTGVKLKKRTGRATRSAQYVEC
jgi:hypothetical protein